MEKKTKVQKHLTTLGQRGGLATLKKHGPENFSKMARKRWRKVRAAKKEAA